jgi:hypothetical protein
MIMKNSKTPNAIFVKEQALRRDVVDSVGNSRIDAKQLGLSLKTADAAERIAVEKIIWVGVVIKSN